MANELLFKGDIGKSISQTTGIDWTGNTAKQVKIKKPAGTTVTYTGSNVVVDDAATGQIHIVTATGDLSETGEYLFQAKVTISGVELYGPVMGFSVEEVLT